MKKKIREKDDKIRELLELLEREREEKRALMSTSLTISVFNISSNFLISSNQVIHRVQYDQNLANREIERIRQEYRDSDLDN